MYIDYKTFANISNGVAQTMNIIITVCAWTFILPFVQWKKVEGWSTPNKILAQLNQMVVHSLPLISSTINIFLFSDIIIYISDIWYMYVVAILYMGQSLIYKLVTGKTVYSFITWVNWQTYASVVTLFISLAPIHCGTALLT